MPATTRSKTNLQQTHLEDFENKPKKEKATTSKSRRQDTSKSKDTTARAKRKQPEHEEKPQKTFRPTKKQKETHDEASIKPEEGVEDNKPVIINRAPVLQLWAACVAQKLYPNLSWSTHLSIGSAVSALCAISKGRAIGTIDQPNDDPDKKAEKEKKKRSAEKGADDEVDVMSFKLLLEDGSAIVSGTPQKANEAALIKKYGEAEYARTKKTMEEAIDMFEARAKKGELNRTAFHMYEEFRPSVQHGQGGWGKKGELRLEKIRELAEKR
ncbi:hypothetical protein G647_07395 [Cladophialophora carrionii CBS 160.54]|uniref:Uncharacterized protein n=1 Tax=Cladophialophora carrionii CBS 160.54 TaxID=1279043 RepID=V9D4X2_9EURO|nr:uncharacterized protein G647_07395 [Cladophialophora carrionii CBS 160.54]ETI21052.1 hypothetical protein G647_07395 [Cladophialophora carrionii CBS 160.54]